MPRCAEVFDESRQITRPRPIDALTNRANPRVSTVATRTGEARRRGASPPATDSDSTGSGGGACAESLVTSAQLLPSHQR